MGMQNKRRGYAKRRGFRPTVMGRAGASGSPNSSILARARLRLSARAPPWTGLPSFVPAGKVRSAWVPGFVGAHAAAETADGYDLLYSLIRLRYL